MFIFWLFTFCLIYNTCSSTPCFPATEESYSHWCVSCITFKGVSYSVKSFFSAALEQFCSSCMAETKKPQTLMSVELSLINFLMRIASTQHLFSRYSRRQILLFISRKRYTHTASNSSSSALRGICIVSHSQACMPSHTFLLLVFKCAKTIHAVGSIYVMEMKFGNASELYNQEKGVRSLSHIWGLNALVMVLHQPETLRLKMSM